MRKEKVKKVMISIYEPLWNEFIENCHNEYKTASGVIRELVTEWNERCEDDDRKKSVRR
jgi:hypothetical protein